MEKENSINLFINSSKKYLSEYFKSQIKNSDVSLREVYPINYNDDNLICDFNFDTNALDYLGQLYEQILSPDIRKDYGQFFTRDTSLIDLMLKDVDLLSGKILEPSCGSGMFLVNVVQKIIIDLKRRGYDSSEIIKHIVNNVCGNDIDDIAIQISELNILASLMPLIIEAVNNHHNFKMPKLNLKRYDFIDKTLINDKYSVIIGNPPFVTMYGKRSRNMTEEKRAYFNTFDFVVNKNGNNKFNMSMFFVENGLKSLIKGGRLIFILDISFFETAYNDLRKYLIQNFKINRIIKGIQAFEGVASGQIVLDVSNDERTSMNVTCVDLEKITSIEVPQNFWNNEKSKYKILMPLNKYEDSITKKIVAFPKLEHFFPNKGLRTCCALTGKTEDFLVEKDENIPFEIFPYLEGSKGLIGKFETPRAYRYIKYDYNLQLELSDIFKRELEKQGVKNKKRVTLGDKEAYLSPKLFIRQSATELITTFTVEPFAANNSLYVLTNKSDSKEEIELLKYTCGVLNSDLITFYCRIHKIIRMEKGKTPQIKISDLKNICINLDEEQKPKVIEIVDYLLNNPSDKTMLKKLNTIIYEIYDISPDEIAYISEFLKQKNAA